MDNITIGITACGNYANYYQWFVNEPGVQVVKLDYADDNFPAIEGCDGIVLSGGQDVHPRYYGKDESIIPNATAIDEQRDEFEWKVLEHSQQKQLPLLGICRGLQLTNVFFGGTLIPDIPSAGMPNHSKMSENTDRYHSVHVEPDSRLAKLVKTPTGMINSAHHQSTADTGKGLIATAFSTDGIIEALERSDPQNKAYLMLVQWHPERMTDLSSPFSWNIKKDFLDSVRASLQTKALLNHLVATGQQAL